MAVLRKPPGAPDATGICRLRAASSGWNSEHHTCAAQEAAAAEALMRPEMLVTWGDWGVIMEMPWLWWSQGGGQRRGRRGEVKCGRRSGWSRCVLAERNEYHSGSSATQWPSGGHTQWCARTHTHTQSTVKNNIMSVMHSVASGKNQEILVLSISFQGSDIVHSFQFLLFISDSSGEALQKCVQKNKKNKKLIFSPLFTTAFKNF